MALLTLTVNDASPALTTRAQEVQRIARALDLASTDIRKNGGTKTSGNINDDGAAWSVRGLTRRRLQADPAHHKHRSTNP